VFVLDTYLLAAFAVEFNHEVLLSKCGM